MSKELAFEGKELESFGYDNMPTYREVMNRHKVEKSEDLTPRESVVEIDKLRESVYSINAKISELKVLASHNIFAFDNPFNAPLSVCIEMINSPSTPYFYISPTIKTDCIKRPNYEGEEYLLRKCVKNPVFDWEGEEGQTLKYKEGKYYEHE